MDRRKQNGGHSTKSTGTDKRKNEYKDLLDLAATPDEVVEVIKVLKQKAIEKQDVNAIKLFLEYYLGKPKETIDNNVTLNEFNIKSIIGVKREV